MRPLVFLVPLQIRLDDAYWIDFTGLINLACSVRQKKPKKEPKDSSPRPRKIFRDLESRDNVFAYVVLPEAAAVIACNRHAKARQHKALWVPMVTFCIRDIYLIARPTDNLH